MTGPSQQRPQGRLAGQVALVTGGSRGIGLAIAREFAREGADLLLAARDAGSLQAAQQALSAFGGVVQVLPMDVSRREDCEQAVAQALRLSGRLDILVNCAAVYLPRPFLDYTEADFAHVLAVNLHAPARLMQLVLPHMVAQGGGRIVNVASTAGKWASRHQAAYNVSKHALVGLTRCTALEFAHTGVTVNALCPGFVQTDLADGFVQAHAALNGRTPEAQREDMVARVPIGRLLDPEECAHLAVYLASPQARAMTGQSVVIDGGMLFV